MSSIENPTLTAGAGESPASQLLATVPVYGNSLLRTEDSHFLGRSLELEVGRLLIEPVAEAPQIAQEVK